MPNKNLPIPPMTQEEIALFWSRMRIGAADACWEWQAGRTGDGYGAFVVFPQIVVLAHRIAYFLHTGIDPIGKLVRHYECDNPPCCNPTHLKAGSNADNSQDMVRNGRSLKGDKNPMRKYPDKVLRGEKNGNSKYTETIVLEMLTLQEQGMSQRAISRQFKIPIVMAQRILNREVWKHVIFPPSSGMPSL
jgi:hypothetical protein